MVRRKVRVLAVLSLAAAALLAPLLADPAAAALFGRRAAPSFELARVGGGEPVRLADFRGKVVLVNFWATWCEPCREELPALLAVRDELAGRGFEIVGISVDEGDDAGIVAFLRSHGVDFPVAREDETIRGRFGGIRGTPTSFLIDRDGGIATIFRGPVEAAVLRAAVQGLLSPPRSKGGGR